MARYLAKKYAQCIIDECNRWNHHVYQDEENKILSIYANQQVSFWADTEEQRKKLIKKIHELMNPEEITIIDQGSAIIIKKNENDYAILDRVDDKIYRVKNGIKRENKNLSRFTSNVNHHSIYTDDNVIKYLIQHIKHNHTTKPNEIIEYLCNEEIQEIEKWLRLDPEGFNQKGMGSYGSYRIKRPIIKPKDISKGIRKELIQMGLICQNEVIDDIFEFGIEERKHRWGSIAREDSNKLKQQEYFNVFKTIYMFLNQEENYRLLLSNSREKIDIFEDVWTLNKLIKRIIEYNIDTKSFCEYMNKVNFTEGLNFSKILKFYPDYIKLEYILCDGRTSKMRKYPSYLASMHEKNVTAERLKNYEKYERINDKEQLFKESITKIEHVEYDDKEYCVIVPQTPYDIVEEGIDNMNCVGSYVSDVINNRTNIVFIRKTEHPDKSYITCEISNNMKIVQILRGNNDPLDNKDKDFVRKWANEKDLTYNG